MSHHRVVRKVGHESVPFTFHVKDLDDNHGAFIASTENLSTSLLLHIATNICKELGIRGAEFFVIAGPEKEDRLEWRALDMIAGMCTVLERSGVPYRQMQRRTNIPGINRITDSVVFNLVLPT